VSEFAAESMGPFDFASFDNDTATNSSVEQQQTGTLRAFGGSHPVFRIRRRIGIVTESDRFQTGVLRQFRNNRIAAPIGKIRRSVDLFRLRIQGTGKTVSGGDDGGQCGAGLFKGFVQGKCGVFCCLVRSSLAVMRRCKKGDHATFVVDDSDLQVGSAKIHPNEKWLRRFADGKKYILFNHDAHYVYPSLNGVVQ
jgi:hypothetical protein